MLSTKFKCHFLKICLGNWSVCVYVQRREELNQTNLIHHNVNIQTGHYDWMRMREKREMLQTNVQVKFDWNEKPNELLLMKKKFIY